MPPTGTSRLLVVAVLGLNACADARPSSPGKLTGSMGGSVDRVLWLFGGEGKHGPSNEVWSVDLSDLRWQRHPDMPSPRVRGTAAWDGEGAFLVVGGCVTDDCDTVVRFDVDAQAWTPLASAPGDRTAAGLAFAGDTAWLFGGVEAETEQPLDDVGSYGSGWTALQSWPQVLGPTFAASSVVTMTLADGQLTRWAGAIPEAMATPAELGSDVSCFWLDEDLALAWAGYWIVDCASDTLDCFIASEGLRGAVDGALCAPIDGSLWTYGGGSVEDGTLSNELWRYHDDAWTQKMEGGDGAVTRAGGARVV